MTSNVLDSRTKAGARKASAQDVNDFAGQIAAIHKSQAVIEFEMDGTILTANENFLKTVGYSLQEIRGQHHSMFVESQQRNSHEYRMFWDRLNKGEYQSAEYKRVGKGGKEIWIQASYNPILGLDGKPCKVVKFATDITEQKLQNADYAGQIEAIGKSQAVIEFQMDGTILAANENFLKTMGYSLAEIQGKHHSMFVESNHRNSAEYRDFWARLNRGEHQSAEYKRLGKGGKEIWIQASYNPILDLDGKPCKVVKFATDVSAQKQKNGDYSGQIEAIGKSQAVIEFEMDGTILAANDNFLTTVGYTLREVEGKHHSMFVESSHRNSAEYRDFWARLNKGEYQAGEYMRIGKGGREVWIQASYNPILDLNGKPFKVVKFATDVTKQKLCNADYSGQIEAIGKSQAVIEFEMDGTIRTANENFLRTMGYSLAEIQGKHHSLFVDSKYRNSTEYGEFWARLNRGEYQAGEYKRIGRGGKEVWIQASYNPILDLKGRPVKVVKYATDVTRQAVARDEMNGIISSLANSSEELTAISQQMGSNAEETSIQARTVASASDEVSRNVQTVAAGTEEMNASIREISRNSTEAARIATNAVAMTATANQTVSKLGDSSADIGKIIKVITSIAQQTNLLALNATIEAARAGEAGKGFAVVANEVKELAKETARATEEIGQKIEAIQKDTKEAVNAIARISEIITQVNDISASIAGAVEQQSATTSEMTKNIGDAARSTSDIAQNISSVTTAAQDTSAGASETQKAAREVASMAENLRVVAANFTSNKS